jgi:hypothetical protein
MPFSKGLSRRWNIEFMNPTSFTKICLALLAELAKSAIIVPSHDLRPECYFMNRICRPTHMRNPMQIPTNDSYPNSH